MTAENANSVPHSSTGETSVSGRNPKSTPNGPFRHFRLLTAAFLIGCLAAAGYYWETQIFAPTMSLLETRVLAIESKSDVNGARLEEIKTETAAREVELQTVLNDITGLEERLGSLGDAIKVLYPGEAQSSLPWILAEAEYLVLAGIQRLVLEQDTKSAIAALSTANDRLLSAEYSALGPLREQIKQDLAILHSIDLPDVTAFAAYLGETVDGIDQLLLKPITHPQVQVVTSQHDDFVGGKWERIAKAMWNDVLSLVEIDDGELPNSVLFDPRTSRFLQQSLRLELANARLSVLRRDEKNFGISSKLIIETLSQHYDTEDAAVIALIVRLKKEQARNLNPAMPDLSGSVDMIRSLRLSESLTNTADISLGK